MAGPTIRLTFAGDSTDLDRAAARAGESTRRMADDIGDASDRARSAGGGLDALGDASDGAESKLTGFADIVAGFSDTATAFAEGDVAGMAAGLASMAGGIAAFVVPVLGTLAATLRTAVGGAMSFIAAHPLVFALLALAAVFVLLWMNSQTFRDIVIGVFNAVSSFITSSFGAAMDWVRGAIDNMVGWFSALPGRIGGFFRAVGDGIRNAFSGAFSGIKSLWNNTVGRINFTIPSWVPLIGGRSFGMPRFHTGGVVPGTQGQEMMAILQAGERVIPRGQAAGGGGGEIRFVGNTDTAVATLIMHLVRTGKIQMKGV